MEHSQVTRLPRGRKNEGKERKKLSAHFFRIHLTFVAQTNCQLFVH